ncbi:MAG: hypothetical protein ACHQ53_11590 [Polyangiales bacterium]
MGAQAAPVSAQPGAQKMTPLQPSQPGGGSAGAGAPSAGVGAGGAGNGGNGMAGASAAAPQTGQWIELLKGTWQLTPGEETYYCVRKTVTEDLYIHGFRAIAPTGTHHTVLSIGAPSGADGIAACGILGAGSNAPNMIFGSGVGTGEFVFPDGIALKVPAGQQLLSNLHLFNSSTQPLSGESGNDALIVSQDQAKYLADNMLAGPTLFSIPADGQPTTITGHCTMDANVKIFAVQPHMHLLATHQKVVAETSGGDVVLHDGDYTFDNQIYYTVMPAPVDLQAGQAVRIECTYVNNTGAAVGFGESTTNEMCLASVYRYPASGAGHVICSR